MQRSVSVQRLHVVLDDVVPLRAQVDKASRLDLLSFPVEDVMPCCLVLDCCNQSFGYEPLTKKGFTLTITKVWKAECIIQWDKKKLKLCSQMDDSWNQSTPGTRLEWLCLSITMSYSCYNLYTTSCQTSNMIELLRCEKLKWKWACLLGALNTSDAFKCKWVIIKRCWNDSRLFYRLLPLVLKSYTSAWIKQGTIYVS